MRRPGLSWTTALSLRLSLLRVSLAFPNGAPEGVCHSTLPQHGGFQKLNGGDSPYRLVQEKAVFHPNESMTGKRYTDSRAKLSVMNQRLGALLPLLSKVGELMSVKETVVSIEKSVQELSSRYDTLLTVVTSQGKAISELAAKVEKVESGSSAEEVRALKRELNDLDQYSRRQNLEIPGIKPTEGENLLRELNNIARRLNIAEVTERDLDTMHRLPSKLDKVPVIIARFALRATKENWLEQRPQLKAKLPGIHFFDKLTPHNKKLLWFAKTKATEQSYKFIWQKNGRILVRKREGKQAIQIKTEADLAKIA
ncbi:hypothetical protein HPB49_010223 [Dermacentor silvarum]|uniref:Uncharacterized protein n=1 Tax=Dermacentor silvarum TaxID=543639 RepID=A0ACB8DZX5_DERSI|nr:hypothetical protein HPB49_010223 [Dermacentor silvarum]